MTIIAGVSCFYHDASISVLEKKQTTQIKFASHSERFSGIKNDPLLNYNLIDYALDGKYPDVLVYYEKPWIKALRFLKSGEYDKLWSLTTIKKRFRDLNLLGPSTRFMSVGHHQSHAAAGYYTSGFYDAAILVVDAIGELDTISIWSARNNQMKKVFSLGYPHSLGLFYSAITKRIGFKPNEEEYIAMGLSSFGEPKYKLDMLKDLISYHKGILKAKINLHRGCKDWRSDLNQEDFADIAASAQAITEQYLLQIAHLARMLVGSKNLVFMGGVALNCKANSILALNRIFENIWIMPNPGDAGSSLGAALLYGRQQVNFHNAYLGYEIIRKLDIDAVVQSLNRGLCTAVAHGRAEFGPRAFGNRSLLLDPRLPDGKDLVNRIKGREPFRPFAPAVLEEHVHEYFDYKPGLKPNPYMQYVVEVKNPQAYPAICHVDNTARVQIVRPQDGTFRQILQAWYEKTGCPILLNTSLNVKGKPLVNDLNDAQLFYKTTGVQVY